MDTDTENVIAFYRGLLDIMPCMMFVKDAEGRLTDGNRAFVDYMGAAGLDELLDKCDHDFYPRELAESFARDDARVMAMPLGEAHSFVQTGPAPDGKVHHLRMKKIHVEDVDGKPSLLGLAVDQTDLYTALERAVKAEEDKSAFFATVSHDIRTPLNAIVGFCQLLKVGIADETERQNALSALVSSSNTLLKLISDVLDLSKLEANRLELVTETTNCEAIVKDVLNTFAGVVQIKKLKVITDVRVAPLLEIDSRRLRQIIFNLFGNAVKFTDRGEIALSVVYDAAASRLTMRVRDTGCGISSEDQKRIADPYASADLNGHSGGMELGLAVVKRLVFRMNGEIDMQSAVGVGTTFTVDIPNIKASSISREREYARTQRIKAVVGTHPNRPTTDILVVDDSKINLLVLKSMLAKLGYAQITTAVNGRDALVKLSANPRISHVLTDIWMPEMDGYQFAKAVKDNPKLKHVKVYAITADAEIRNNYDETGFLDVLTKPVTIETLEKVL